MANDEVSERSDLKLSGAPFHGAHGEGRSAISPAASQTGAEPCACAFPAERVRRNAPVISDNAVVVAPMNWRAESTDNPLPLSRSAIPLAENHGKSRSAMRISAALLPWSATVVLRASEGRRKEESRWRGGFPAARLSSSRVDWLAQPMRQIWHKIVSAVFRELFQLCFSRRAGLPITRRPSSRVCLFHNTA